MKTINILTAGFDTPNGAAFLYPLIQHRRALYDYQVKINFFKCHQKLTDADIIILDSKYFRNDWHTGTDQVLSIVKKLRGKAESIIFFDINDSSGWPHARILPAVDRYVKNQILVDTSYYLKPLYAHRLYTDYYHQHFNVVDQTPSYSEPIIQKELLSKLKVGWNSGLADYSLYGPYWMRLYHYLPVSCFLFPPQKWTAPSLSRSQKISCRMGITYSRDSISWQRRQIQMRLKGWLPTEKVSRSQYYRELQQSRVVISPFGLGEITLKDFEVFLTGGLLVKPDMSHMITWPNWYKNNETVLMHRWDLSDLEELIERLTTQFQDVIDIAVNGQANYRRYLQSKEASDLFCQHFLSIIF